jgi:phage FluMu protein Com
MRSSAVGEAPTVEIRCTGCGKLLVERLEGDSYVLRVRCPRCKHVTERMRP